ncbi:uncharacterized protein LOC142937891 isoform X2 [Anarhichas minor]|uniref:uncharacterized protein LOC142937891 isoform X2 n=1 Tax=Anarhichas minor TaxID=65739 RepID=UPI003F7404A9
MMCSMLPRGDRLPRHSEVPTADQPGHGCFLSWPHSGGRNSPLTHQAENSPLQEVEPVSAPEPEPVKVPEPEPVKVPEPVPEPVLAPEPITVPETLPEPELVPEPLSAPESAPEQAANPEPLSEPKPVPEPAVVPDPEPVVESEPESEEVVEQFLHELIPGSTEDRLPTPEPVIEEPAEPEPETILDNDVAAAEVKFTPGKKQRKFETMMTKEEIEEEQRSRPHKAVSQAQIHSHSPVQKNKSDHLNTTGSGSLSLRTVGRSHLSRRPHLLVSPVRLTCWPHLLTLHATSNTSADELLNETSDSFSHLLLLLLYHLLLHLLLHQ